MKKMIVAVAASVVMFATFLPILSQAQSKADKASQAIVGRMEKVIQLTPQQKDQLVKIYDQSFAEQAAHRKKLQEDLVKVIGEQNFSKYVKTEQAEAAKKCENMDEATTPVTPNKK